MSGVQIHGTHDYAAKSHARIMDLLQSLAMEHQRLFAYMEDMILEASRSEDAPTTLIAGVVAGFSANGQAIHDNETVSLDELLPLDDSASSPRSGLSTLPMIMTPVSSNTWNKTSDPQGRCYIKGILGTSNSTFSDVPKFSDIPQENQRPPVNWSKHSSIPLTPRDSEVTCSPQYVSKLPTSIPASDGSHLSSQPQVTAKNHTSGASECGARSSNEVAASATLDHVHPSILYRLQARVGVLSWQSSVSHTQIWSAVRSLGLEKFSIYDMKKLITQMVVVSGAAADMDEFPVHRRVLARLGSTASVLAGYKTSDALYESSVGNESLYEETHIPFNYFAEYLISDSKRQKLGPECSEIAHTLKEVLLSGDANRLVAELTSVRVDDLAAPLPQFDWDTFFEPIIGFVILLNGVVIGIQTDSNLENEDAWIWAEAAFTCFFLLEMLIRIYFLGACQYFFGGEKLWALLDTCIVVMGIVDFGMYVAKQEVGVGALTIIRSFRMVRITRLFRIFRLGFLRELNIMVKGLLAGMKTLAWALVLLFFTIYLIAVLTTHTLGKNPKDEYVAADELFTSVPRSMLTCFRCFVGDCTTSDGRAIVKLMSDAQGVPFVIGYLASFTTVTLGLFNLIMALYVEITMEAAKRTEDIDKKRQQRESLRIAHTTKALLKKFCVTQQLADHRHMPKTELSRILKNSDDQDLDSDMSMSKELFLLIVQDPEVQKLMNELDIPPDRAHLFEVLDADGTGDLHVTELVHGLLKVRGEARKSDIIASLLAVRAVQDMLRLLERKVLSNQKKMMDQMGIRGKHKRTEVSIWDYHARMSESTCSATPL